MMKSFLLFISPKIDIHSEFLMMPAKMSSGKKIFTILFLLCVPIANICAKFHGHRISGSEIRQGVCVGRGRGGALSQNPSSSEGSLKDLVEIGLRF